MTVVLARTAEELVHEYQTQQYCGVLPVLVLGLDHRPDNAFQVGKFFWGGESRSLILFSVLFRLAFVPVSAAL